MFLLTPTSTQASNTLIHANYQLQSKALRCYINREHIVPKYFLARWSSRHGATTAGYLTEPSQHALECDRCQQCTGTHRLCGTGISYTQYRGIMEDMRYSATFPWTCQPCTTEAANNEEALILHSTRIDAAAQ